MFDLNILKENNEIVEREGIFYTKRWRNKIKLPRTFSPDLVYFIGALIGDGTVHNPMKRNIGGQYWKLYFVGRKEFLEIIEELTLKLFNYNVRIYKRKDRENTWRLYINSLIIHRFFNKVIGFPMGKKAGNINFLDKLKIPQEYYKYLLAGLIDTDGYVSSKYIGFIQKDKNFLEQIKLLSKENLNIEFKGPNVNKKINGVPVGWIITINKKDDIKSFLKLIPLRYKGKALVAQLG